MTTHRARRTARTARSAALAGRGGPGSEQSNEGTEPCWVTSYPAVKLGDGVDGAALPHSAKDKPGGDQHITLQPGAKV
ncbi:DUF4232 domain-containing protein [Streptomyces massasporeus]